MYSIEMEIKEIKLILWARVTVSSEPNSNQTINYPANLSI